MVSNEEIISFLKELDKKQISLVIQEAALIAAGISSIEEQSCRDFVPIDVPIEWLKDKETGVLQIRFPFAIGLRNTLGWKEMEVTQAAQATLVQIFRESLEEDLNAGRIQTTKINLQ